MGVLLMILAAGSCTGDVGSQANITATSDYQDTLNAIATDTPWASTGLLSSPAPAAAGNVLQMELEIERRCPRSATRDLDELGLQSGSSLLVSPDIDDDMRTWEILDARGDRTPISLLHDALGRITFAGVSPGHGWIAYYAPGATDQLVDLWVGSLANGEVVRVMEGLKTAHLAQWISEEEIAIFYSERGPSPVYATWFIINVTSGERRLIPRVWVWGEQAFSPDANRLIYHDYTSAPDSGLVLLDLETGKARPVLPWIDDPEEGQEAWTPWIGWTAEGVTVARISDRSVTIAVNVPEDSLVEESIPRVRLVFPSQRPLGYADSFSPLDRTLPIWTSPGNALWPVWWGYGREPDTEWEFLLLDTTSWRAYDYCLAPWWLSPGPLAISPDGRFLSITSRNPELLASVALDLETGLRAELPGSGIWGWVLTSE
jgi:hypothetical protein